MYYSHIDKVLETSSIEEVNQLLATGWQLLSIRPSKEAVIYLLGHKRAVINHLHNEAVR